MRLSRFLALPEETGSIDLAHSSFAAEGDLSFAALAKADREGDYASLLQQLTSISFELSELGLVLTETARQDMTAGIESMMGPIPLLREYAPGWYTAVLCRR